ncbi:RteC domain-containing protein [Dysgonomonas sp. 521]|uniref:RteC domain-containing protein n=1 Tax=Dysgonomonas sp. 521 TaxID=2302932 RepID=UPI0013D2792F|nr:RteC domain-containing protein [Dysgonomonas sp. 521]
MENFVARLRQEMNSSLHAIEGKCTADNEKTREAILLLEDILEKLRVFMSDYEFKDKQQEIDFFRIHKPSLLCYLLLYRKMYDIVINRPQGGSKVQKQYLHKEQGQISAFFFRHREFYRYYRSGDTHFDCYYFLRGKPQKNNIVYNLCYRPDPQFSSGGDLLVAQILANDILDVYLEKELEKLEKPAEAKKDGYGPPAVWTAKKIDLLEMIYGQYCTCSVNNGRISLKQLVIHYERTFNIELLSLLPKAWFNLTNRKNPTAFLDKMRKRFRDRMDEEDNNDIEKE